MKLSLIDAKSRWRFIRHWPLFCALAFMLVPVLHGQTPPDIPSGFMPGIINDFAGNGTNGGAFSNGSLPAQVPIGGGLPYMVTDSKGNAYIAVNTVSNNAMYMVYAGGAIPAALANVTTNASPSVTPVAGRIYQIAFQQYRCSGNATVCGEGKPLNQVGFVEIVGLAIDSQDNLYYLDSAAYGQTYADVVRKVDATTSNVTTVAGQWGQASSSSNLGDGGLATSATLNYPIDIKLDSYGNLYILDAGNYVVRVAYLGSQPPPILAAENVTVGPSQKGFIYTVMGQADNSCQTEGCGDGSSAVTSAQLDYPDMSIDVDAAGNLYIADIDFNNYFNNFIDSAYIRVVYAGGTVPTILNQYLNPSGGTSATPMNGYIYPVTGYGANTQYASCTTAGCGDGGLAADVEFGSSMYGYAQLYIRVDDPGNLYIADYYGPAVRKIDTSGYASTVAGIDDPNLATPATCSALTTAPNFSADCLAYNAALTDPTFISFDAQNNLYIADSGIVWEVAPLLPQTIDFSTLNSPVTYGVGSIALGATASSGLAVQYSVSATSPATVNGSSLVIIGAGTIDVTASQTGNTKYAAATPVTQHVTVDKAQLTVTDLQWVCSSGYPG
jgi:hypothetical protein